MSPFDLVLLVGSGLAGGYLAGLAGVGGGIVFAPVLFFYFQSRGIHPSLVTPLTLGSSLFCTAVASLVSAVSQWRRKAVDLRTAVMVGASSGVFAWLVTRTITTQFWYDMRVFQLVFACVLLAAVFRMFGRSDRKMFEDGQRNADRQAKRTSGRFAVVLGAATGTLASAAGVGGGVLMVPAFANLLRFPMTRAVGTSSAAIVLVALGAMFGYMNEGWDVVNLPGSMGYVNFREAALLAVPAAFSARLGVWTAHRIDTQNLRKGFAVFVFLVALRLLWKGLAG
jgi:uncharacterized protein